MDFEKDLILMKLALMTTNEILDYIDNRMGKQKNVLLKNLKDKFVQEMNEKHIYIVIQLKKNVKNLILENKFGNNS